MAVGTLDEDGLAVDEQLSALDLDMTEAHTQRNYLQHLVAILEIDI